MKNEQHTSPQMVKNPKIWQNTRLLKQEETAGLGERAGLSPSPAMHSFGKQNPANRGL